MKLLKIGIPVAILALIGGAAAVVVLNNPARKIEQAFARMPEPAGRPVAWQADIKPLLDQHCIRCHGLKAKKGGFQYDKPESMRAGGKSGPAAVAGDSKNSLIIKSLVAFPGVTAMPRGGGAPVPPDQIALLRAWIDQGMNFE